ncbi:MAG: tRNA (guanosine(46)-N7)-methyltransferase TrmB, partial [Flavobacteriaceae bacterium]
NEGAPQEVLSIQTFYERQYLEKGKPITYLQFRLN